METKLVICKENTKANVLNEMRVINPYIITHKDQAERFANLWTLYHSLWYEDSGIKQLANRFDLMDMVAWKPEVAV